MRFEEIGLKDLVLDFDSNDLQDITIVQGDTKTRGFKVLVSTNNGEIIKASSNYEMRLYGINSNYPDKSFFTKGTIDGDFYKVYISTDMASKSGKLQLQLALFEGTNALIQSRIKEVDVYRSIANGGEVGKDLVVDFGRLQEALDRVDVQEKKYKESIVRQEVVESKIAEKHTEVVQIRDGLKDVLNTENARVEAEKKRVSVEQTRVSQEKTRQSNEQTRISNETARKQSEDTRNSQEKTRQSQEQSRKDEETKRATVETSREQSEQTRAKNETERQNAEKERQSNEQTRVSQENSRVEAEKQRAKSENDRAGKFDSWDKTMQGVIPTATSTVAGIVKIDVDGESTAVSKKTHDEAYSGVANGLSQKADVTHIHEIENIYHLQEALDLKANKLNVENLEMEVGNFKTDMSALNNKLDEKADNSDLQQINRAVAENSQFIMNFPKELENKADKTHQHKIEDVEELLEHLKKKSGIYHKHKIEDVSDLQKELDGKASSSELSNLKSKVDNLSTDKISNKNGNGSLSFWTGTQSQYNSISSKDSNTIYFITE